MIHKNDTLRDAVPAPTCPKCSRKPTTKRVDDSTRADGLVPEAARRIRRHGLSHIHIHFDLHSDFHSARFVVAAKNVVGRPRARHNRTAPPPTTIKRRRRAR